MMKDRYLQKRNQCVCIVFILYQFSSDPKLGPLSLVAGPLRNFYIVKDSAVEKSEEAKQKQC